MQRSIRIPSVIAGAMLLATLTFGSGQAEADSVAQVQTAKRISRTTVVLIDPQGRPDVVSENSDTVVRPGDILTFVIAFTAVPNGGTRGLGGYITDYIPRNTQVVGARLIDADGNTVPPRRGGLGPDGVGDRGANTFTGSVTLNQGSLAQLYADTGIFYSLSPLTERVPVGDVLAETFISLFNGLPVEPRDPTGAGQLRPILGSGDTVFAHNGWDLAQTLAFGIGNGAIQADGKGNTPDMYGSAVAGPETWYPYEASYTGAAGGIPALDTIAATDTIGPWQRIQTVGSEIGRRGAIPDSNGDMPDPGIALRPGIPAVTVDGQPMGWALSADNPLPAYDPSNPSTPYVTAVRYSVGELVVGEEYFAEISLRVLDTPLDPVSGIDVNCAEVFGGDSSAYQPDGAKGGKDHAWRYFLPAPSCVVLNNFFELTVDKLAALADETLTYTIEGKNLSTEAQTNVVIRQCFRDRELSFVSASDGGTHDATGAGCPDADNEEAIVWIIGALSPGEDYQFTTELLATGGGEDTALSRAVYVSDTVPDPGFQVVAITNIRPISIVLISAVASPSSVANAPGRVQYTVTLRNEGTGTATSDDCRQGCQIRVELPGAFALVPGTATIAGTDVADPAIDGQRLTFTDGLVDLVPLVDVVIVFEADIPDTTDPGAYTIAIETWFNGAFGRDIADAAAGLAEVLVGISRTAEPVVDSPLLAGTTTVSGTSTEEEGTVIRVFVAGVEVGTTTVGANGRWNVSIPALFAGQNVTATAEADGALESVPSNPPVVVSESATVTACSDGADNDGDGLTDFPDDPGCLDANDVDETDTPACSDGVDNDSDGAVDYPADPSCSNYLDDSEDGLGECADGEDNDGNGLTDLDDPGCSSADDGRESTPAICNNRLDDDGDGLFDYPADPGCTSAMDDDETNSLVDLDAGSDTGDDAGVDDTGSNNANPDGGDQADAGITADGGAERPNPGGVPAPAAGGGAASDSCGCSVTAAPRSQLIPLLLLGAILVIYRRLR